MAMVTSASRSSARSTVPVGLLGDTSKIARSSPPAPASSIACCNATTSREEAPVEAEPVGVQPHRLQRRQEVEERIARPRHQHAVAGIAQQLEQQRVGLAGAGGEDQVAGVDGEAALGVARGDGAPGLRQALRRGFVGGGARVAQGGGDALRGVGQPDARGIGGGEVEHRRAAGAQARRAAATGRWACSPRAAGASSGSPGQPGPPSRRKQLRTPRSRRDGRGHRHGHGGAIVAASSLAAMQHDRPSLVAYLSGHGFGHFTRSAAVLERLAGRYAIHVRTSAQALQLARLAPLAGVGHRGRCGPPAWPSAGRWRSTWRPPLLHCINTWSACPGW